MREPLGQLEKKHKAIGLSALMGTYGANFSILITTVLQGIILARILGPGGRGEYAAGFMWASFFGNIGLFGTNFFLARLAAKYPDSGMLFRSGIVISTVTGLVSFTAAYWLLPWLLPSEEPYMLLVARIFLILIPFYQVTCILAGLEQGLGNFFRLNFIRFLRNPLYLVWILILALLGYRQTLAYVIAWLSVSALVAVVRMLYFLKDTHLFGRMHPLGSIFRQSVPYGLVEVAQQGYMHADKILLLWLLTKEDLGYYVVALAAASMIRSVTVSMGTIAFTVTARAEAHEGFSQAASLFRKAVLLMFFFGILLAGVMPLIFPIVYGKEFKVAVVPAIILIPASALAGLSLLLDQCMRGQGKPYAGFFSRIGAIVMMATLGFPASKIAGVTGICIVQGLSQLVYLVGLMACVVKHYRGGSFRQFVPVKQDVVAICEKARYSWTRIMEKYKRVVCKILLS